MKTVFSLLLLAALGLQTGFAQELATEDEPANAPENSLKLYPFAFIKSRFAVSYERALENKWAVQLGGGVVSNDQSTFYNSDKVFGFSADVQFRKYLERDKPALSGIYFSPHLVFKRLEISSVNYDPYYPGGPISEGVTFSSNQVQGGLVMGYQLPILKVVVADFYAGGGYRHTNPKGHNYNNHYFIDNTREYTSTGVYPILGMQIGVLF